MAVPGLGAGGRGHGCLGVSGSGGGVGIEGTTQGPRPVAPAAIEAGRVGASRLGHRPNDGWGSPRAGGSGTGEVPAFSLRVGLPCEGFGEGHPGVLGRAGAGSASWEARQRGLSGGPAVGAPTAGGPRSPACCRGAHGIPKAAAAGSAGERGDGAAGRGSSHGSPQRTGSHGSTQPSPPSTSRAAASSRTRPVRSLRSSANSGRAVSAARAAGHVCADGQAGGGAPPAPSMMANRGVGGMAAIMGPGLGSMPSRSRRRRRSSVRKWVWPSFCRAVPGLS